MYATPYLDHATGVGLVAVDEADEVQGYLIGTTETAAFSRWFVTACWPKVSRGRAPRTRADAALLASAADPNRMLVSCIDDFPAHLHIDLLEGREAWGRVDVSSGPPSSSCAREEYRACTLSCPPRTTPRSRSTDGRVSPR
ncbi:hypothetical protein [Labedella populi]|uniref:hypothetical protein n=1 Tax=Labedella populi TaxID=2498850 RepID=UPI001FB75B13|nr:hypothetical protein [Labedella populi]